jgi:hypothetical protein
MSGEVFALDTHIKIVNYYSKKLYSIGQKAEYNKSVILRYLDVE